MKQEDSENPILHLQLRTSSQEIKTQSNLLGNSSLFEKGKSWRGQSEEEEHYKNVKSLEGQCKIESFILLEFSVWKTCILLIPLIISIVGMLALKYSIRFRMLVFYSQIDFQELKVRGSHILVNGGDHECIMKISKIILSDASEDQVERYVFSFKELPYQLNHHKIQAVPIAIPIQKTLHNLITHQNLTHGLSDIQVEERLKYYGKNVHLVDVPNYFEFIFDTMTQPFFVLQYIVSFIFIMEGAVVFGILMISFSFVTTSINYILLYRSFSKIKQTAEKTYDVRVVRNQKEVTIQNIDLVPGDIYFAQKEVPCDSVIIKGELFANEVSLTGENVPIGKFTINHSKDSSNQSHWIFQGSTIMTHQKGTIAVVLNTGFGSRKGRILRKILTKVQIQPQFFKTLIYFMIEVTIVGIILYLSTLWLLILKPIDSILKTLRFFDVLTYTFPAAFPIFFNLAYSFCLIRLNKKDILGTEAEKTVEGSKLETVCFDKTGTLTYTEVKVSEIFSSWHSDKDELENVSKEFESEKHDLLRKLFATCHSVQQINGQFHGDQIDLKMFLHSKYQFQKDSNLKGVVFSATHSNERLDVVKINQYESKFQSMSILVKDSNGKAYIFCKGSPELIHSFSSNQPSNYFSLLKQLSLEGFRCIAVAYREISNQQLNNFILSGDRSQFLKDINLLGIVSFENELKKQTPQLMALLKQANIKAKIITGDNIFVAVQAGKQAGIIEDGKLIMVIQGGKKNGFQKYQSTVLTFIGSEIKQSSLNVSGVNDPCIDDEMVIAIDNDYVKQNQHSFSNAKTKIFARISPENKALIVRKHKEHILDQYQKRTNYQRWFGPCKGKIGMVGDGANDLIAIRQADLGIGISDSDAVYGASFAISNLLMIDEIIREGKSTERQIIETVLFFGLTSFLHIVLSIILTFDSAAELDLQIIYQNFASLLLVTILLSLCSPSAEACSYSPTSNFMGLEYHLVFWGNAIIYSAGYITGFFTYYNSSDYEPNPLPEVSFATGGYISLTKSETVNFLMLILTFNCMCIIIYRSSPWKERIWKNRPLFIVLLANIIAAVVFYFTTPYLIALLLVPINNAQAGILLGVMVITLGVSWIYNAFLERMKFHETQNDILENKYEVMLSQAQ